MTTQTSMQEETDEDLFLYMACKDNPEDKPLAEMAVAELHRRYLKRLYARCFKMVFSQPDPETLAADLASAALARAYEKAETYRSHPDGSASSSRTFSWLCKIALNIFRDFLRNPKRPGSLAFNVIELDVNAEMYLPEEFAALYCDDKEQLSTQADYQLVAEVFDTLDARTQRVLVETLIQRDKSPGRTYMLRGSAELLANRLGTTPANLRRIRKNGIRKINEYINQHKHTSQETNHE